MHLSRTRVPFVLSLVQSTLVLAMLALPAAAEDRITALPSETPEKFTPRTEAFDYDQREVMIAMRDGVKLKTFILVPKGAKNAPMVMTRTPYNASSRISRFSSPRLAAIVPQMNDTTVAAGYIIVYQDVRGKYGSEGDYVMNRPLIGRVNPTAVDHATDTYDSIDWLVKNVPESNGRIATLGGSYEGFTSIVAAIKPHPALKAVVPIAPMIDGWRGDDWFHNGAFRQAMALDFVYNQQSARKADHKWWTGEYDTYDTFLRAGSAGALAASRGLDQLGFWRALVAHSSYDFWWQEQAVDQWLAKEPLKVPMLLVGGLFDQEDIYGAPAVYKALASKDPRGEFVHLVLGPWNHGQSRREGRNLGPVQFEGDTAGYFRRQVMQPFLDHYLKDAPDPGTPRVLAYETGANLWHRYDHWPRACASGCAERAKSLYLLPGGKLGFNPPSAQDTKFDEYVSDPAKPIPYRQRPILAAGTPDSGWGDWLVTDQRMAAARTDVLVYQTEPLTEAVRIAGEPIAQLFASTSGTDSDWVVKIIDVWPDEVPEQPALGGYQQMLSADIFRGRYRVDFAKPQAIPANKTLPYRFALPNASHTFRPGHRIMVQIQSSWFPLYDRNPQTFVSNIMNAQPQDYVKATQRVWHTPATASVIEFPVVSAAAATAQR